MPFTFSLIGCGKIGERHAELMNQRGRLSAVCDTNKERADRISDKFGAKPYYHIADFLESERNIDLVSICTPNGLHAEQTISLLNAGINVLCEKPMAISVPDCDAMIVASEITGQKLFVVKQNRFNPPVIALKKILDEQRLGKVFSIQLNCFWNRKSDYYNDGWRGTKKLDGGTLFTQFSHFIDLLYWLFGDVKYSKGILANYNHKGIIEFEDTGVVILEFVNGIIGTIHYTVNSYDKNMEGSLTVFGEKGTVKIGGQYLNKVEYQNIRDYIIKEGSEKSQANKYDGYQGSMSNHNKVYDNLIKNLNGEEPAYMNPADGKKTVEIIEMIYKNATYLS